MEDLDKAGGGRGLKREAASGLSGRVIPWARFRHRVRRVIVSWGGEINRHALLDIASSEGA